MSRNGSGVYSLPGTYLATTGETIQAQQHNDPLQDLESDANTARPIVAGGTGATSAADALTNLGAAPTASPTFTGVVEIADGTAAAPALTFSSDTNTGIFSKAADKIGFTVGGTEAASISSTGITATNLPKAWARYTQSAGTYTIGDSYNVASLTHTSAGVVTVNFTTALSSTGYAAVVTVAEAGTYAVSITATATSGVSILIRNATTSAATDVGFSVVVF